MSSPDRWFAAHTTRMNRRMVIAEGLGIRDWGLDPNKLRSLPEHTRHHLWRQLSRVRVLSARMIRGDDDGSTSRLVHRAVTKWWARLHCDAPRRHHSPPHVKRNLPESDDHPHVRQVRELCLEMRLACVDFFGSRLVIRWRA